MTSLEPARGYGTVSLIGSATGALGHTCAYPLEVIKTRQQQVGGSMPTAAKALYKENGFSSFYKGFRPQLVRTLINGVWVWPAMKYSLQALKERTTLPAVVQQTLTGSGVAAVTILITNPLEKAKIQAITASGPQPPFSFKKFFQQGWQGARTSWMNVSVNYSAFLISQKHFQKPHADVPPTWRDYLTRGIKVAAVITAASTATDVATTHSMSSGRTIRQLVAEHPPTVFLRGSAASFISRIMRNTLSAWVIEKLGI